MICHGCGTSLTTTVRFCPDCGTRQPMNRKRPDTRKSRVRGTRGRQAISRFVLRSVPGDVTVEIPWNRIIRVGRHPSTDITLIDPSVSRFHAELITTEDGCLVRDLHSSNGTFVNGVSVRELTLRHRDELQFGNVRFSVRDQNAAPDVETPPISLEQPVKDAAGSKLAHLIELSRALAGTFNTEDMLDRIVSGALTSTGADRASIALWDARKQALRTGAFESRLRRAYPEHRIPRSIARHCVDQGVAVVTESAERDSRFSGHSIVALGVRSAMCAPIVDENGKTLGVCYVDKLDDSTPFRAEDLSYLMALSSIAATAMGR